jgi:enhancing lycopene biosynthesis protein 2
VRRRGTWNPNLPPFDIAVQFSHPGPCSQEIAVGERLKIVSTPAYMLGPRDADVNAGIDRLVEAVLERS